MSAFSRFLNRPARSPGSHNRSVAVPGTTSLLVRTASGLCWAALANMRSEGIDLAMDEMM